MFLDLLLVYYFFLKGHVCGLLNSRWREVTHWCGEWTVLSLLQLSCRDQKSNIIFSWFFYRIIKAAKSALVPSVGNLQLSEGEIVLDVDGTIPTQPVLQHIGISAWPGEWFYRLIQLFTSNIQRLCYLLEIISSNPCKVTWHLVQILGSYSCLL